MFIKSLRIDYFIVIIIYLSVSKWKQKIIFYFDIDLLQSNRGKIFHDCNWAQSNSLHQYFILSVSLSSILYHINVIFEFVTLLSISTISSINSNWFNKRQLSGFSYDKKHYHMLTIISLWNKRFLADNWILVPHPTGLD